MNVLTGLREQMENVILTFQEQKDSRKQIHEMKGIIEEVKMVYHFISKIKKNNPIEACRIYYFNLVISVENFWFYLGNVLLKRSNFEILETSQDN